MPAGKKTCSSPLKMLHSQSAALPHTSGTASPPVSTPPPDPSTFLSSIPDRLSQAIELYRKMLPPPPSDEEEAPLDPDRAHPLVYAEACLRCARFLLAVWEAEGSIERALERLVLPPSLFRGDTTPTSPEQARIAQLTSLAPSNTVPRSSIATWVSLAYGPHLASLSLSIHLRVTSEIATLFGRIGYRRKESFVLRELAALCGEAVAGRGIEVFNADPTSFANEPILEEDESGDIGTAATPPPRTQINPLLLPGGGGERGASIVRTTSDPAGNESIIRIAEKVCDAFGIVVVPKAPRRMDKQEKRKSLMQGRPIEIQESGQGHFGWPSLQVGVLRDAIGIAEALPGSFRSSFDARNVFLADSFGLHRLPSGYSIHCHGPANSLGDDAPCRAVPPQPEHPSHLLRRHSSWRGL